MKKILPPSNRSVISVSKETGVAVVTINNWLAKLKEGKMSLDEDDENPSSMRNSREKLDLLIEYQTVSEENQTCQFKGRQKKLIEKKWMLIF